MSDAHFPPTDAMLDLALTHSLGLAMYNAVGAQQQGSIVREAATVKVCEALLTLSAPKGEPAPLPAVDDAAAASREIKAKAETLAAQSLSVPDAQQCAGKIYQSVAQSAAIAVQDAADALRNISTIAGTAAGVAMAQLLANPGQAAEYGEAVAASQQMMAAAVANFEAIGASAAQMLRNFPQGS